ncbi:hypothetical protein ACNKHM_02835 [Shigella sonnei]
MHLLVVALLVVGWMSETLGSRRRRIMRTVLCHGSDDAGVSAPPRATLA